MRHGIHNYYAHIVRSVMWMCRTETAIKLRTSRDKWYNVCDHQPVKSRLFRINAAKTWDCSRSTRICVRYSCMYYISSSVCYETCIFSDTTPPQRLSLFVRHPGIPFSIIIYISTCHLLHNGLCPTQPSSSTKNGDIHATFEHNTESQRNKEFSGVHMKANESFVKNYH